MTPDNDKHGWLTVGLVLLVVLAGCAGGGGGGDGGGTGPPGARDGGSAGGSSAGDGGDAGAGSFHLGEERVVVREASMGVEVERFDPAFDRARAIVRENGGFVADWEVEVARGWHVATLEARVPSGNFGEVRDGLAGLGQVEREHVEAADFTATDDDLEAELADLRARERELEGLLERETDSRRARRIQRELADVRGTIREKESRRASPERKDALSTVSLSLHEPEGAKPPRNAEVAAGFDAAFLSAFYGGLVVVKYALALVGFALPVGLVVAGSGAAGVVSVRLARRTWAGFDALLARVGLGPAATGTGRDRDEE